MNFDEFIPQDSPLHQAVSRGDLEAVKILLAEGADVHAVGSTGMTPLHEAIAQMLSSFQEIKARISAEKTEVPAENSLANLSEALQKFDIRSMAKQLRDRPETPAPVTRDSPEIVRLLLEQGADTNARTEAGKRRFTGRQVAGKLSRHAFCWSSERMSMLPTMTAKPY